MSERTGAVTMLGSLKPLLAELSAHRRRQLRYILMLMLVGGVAEMMSLGAVLAFLVLLSGSGSDSPFIAPLSDFLAIPSTSKFPWAAALLLVVVGAVAATVRLVLAWVSQKLVLRVGHDLGVKLYSRVLHQPYSSYSQRSTSDILAAVEKVQTVVFGIFLPVMQSLVSAVVAFFIVISLFMIDHETAAIAALAVAVPYAIVSFAAAGVLRSTSADLASKQTARIKQVQEGLGGLRDIIIDQSQTVFIEEFRRLDHAYRNAQTRYIFASGAPRFIVEFAGLLLIAAMALFLSARDGGLAAAIPVLGAMALGAQRLLPLAQQIYMGWGSLLALDDVTKDILVLLRAPIMTQEPRDKTAPVVTFRRKLQLEGVGFRYAGTEESVLKDINLTIERGERIGFFGPTGSGKSTLLDIIMGLLEPTDGTIRVDGMPLADQNVSAWQAQIAHVPQTIYLADGSIAANIAFGETPEDIDLPQVREAAERAQIAPFIDSLPAGFRTRTGERGVRLSGGQRQRIGIARALYKRANVLILDEATSALDDATELAVMGSLVGTRDELTVLMIAHRLSTLSKCDRVVRLAAGTIIEVGSYHEMVSSPAASEASRQSLSQDLGG